MNPNILETFIQKVKVVLLKDPCMYRLGDSKCVDNGRPCGRITQHAELLALTLLTTNNQECHSNAVGLLRDLMS